MVAQDADPQRERGSRLDGEVRPAGERERGEVQHEERDEPADACSGVPFEATSAQDLSDQRCQSQDDGDTHRTQGQRDRQVAELLDAERVDDIAPRIAGLGDLGRDEAAPRTSTIRPVTTRAGHRHRGVKELRRDRGWG